MNIGFGTYLAPHRTKLKEFFSGLVECAMIFCFLSVSFGGARKTFLGFIQENQSDSSAVGVTSFDPLAYGTKDIKSGEIEAALSPSALTGLLGGIGSFFTLFNKQVVRNDDWRLCVASHPAWVTSLPIAYRRLII